jgi:hypothetical protein
MVARPGFRKLRNQHAVMVACTDFTLPVATTSFCKNAIVCQPARKYDFDP